MNWKEWGSYGFDYFKYMKKSLTIFFQAIVVFIGIGTLVFMLWEPHLEGRNANATPFEIYFNDLFLIYAYAVSIAFFILLSKVFKLLGEVGRNEVFSETSMKALRTIKYCAMFLVVFIVVPEVYLFTVRPGDDIAGGVAIGFFLILIFTIIATVATKVERILRNKLNIKS